MSAHEPFLIQHLVAYGPHKCSLGILGDGPFDEFKSRCVEESSLFLFQRGRPDADGLGAHELNRCLQQLGLDPPCCCLPIDNTDRSNSGERCSL